MPRPHLVQLNMFANVKTSTSARDPSRGRERSRGHVPGLKSEDSEPIVHVIEDSGSASEATIPDRERSTRHRSSVSSNESENETPEPRSARTVRPQVSASNGRRRDAFPVPKLPPNGLATPRKPKQSAPVTPGSRHGQTPISVPSSRKRAASSRADDESPTRRIRRERLSGAKTPSTRFDVPDDGIFSPAATSRSFSLSFDGGPKSDGRISFTQQDSEDESDGLEQQVAVLDGKVQEVGVAEWQGIYEYDAIAQGTGRGLGDILPEFGPDCPKCGEPSYRKQTQETNDINAGRFLYTCTDTAKCKGFVTWGDLVDVGPVPGAPRGLRCGCDKYYRSYITKEGRLKRECAELKCGRVLYPS